MAGFPNLFTVTGPGSPSLLTAVIVAIEHHVEWIGDAIEYLRERRIDWIEPDRDAQVAWWVHVQDVANSTLFPLATNSYYVGANVPGKPHVFSIYLGGLGEYRRRCDDIIAEGYRGFAFADAGTEP
jgi:cyclohexanone monooxygenase